MTEEAAPYEPIPEEEYVELVGHLRLTKDECRRILELTRQPSTKEDRTIHFKMYNTLFPLRDLL